MAPGPHSIASAGSTDSLEEFLLEFEVVRPDSEAQQPLQPQQAQTSPLGLLLARSPFRGRPPRPTFTSSPYLPSPRRMSIQAPEYEPQALLPVQPNEVVDLSETSPAIASAGCSPQQQQQPIWGQKPPLPMDNISPPGSSAFSLEAIARGDLSRPGSPSSTSSAANRHLEEPLPSLLEAGNPLLEAGALVADHAALGSLPLSSDSEQPMADAGAQSGSEATDGSDLGITPRGSADGSSALEETPGSPGAELLQPLNPIQTAALQPTQPVLQNIVSQVERGPVPRVAHAPPVRFPGRYEARRGAFAHSSLRKRDYESELLDRLLNDNLGASQYGYHALSPSKEAARRYGLNKAVFIAFVFVTLGAFLLLFTGGRMHAQRVMHARGPPLTLDARPAPAGPQNIALLVGAASEASGDVASPNDVRRHHANAALHASAHRNETRVAVFKADAGKPSGEAAPRFENTNPGDRKPRGIQGFKLLEGGGGVTLRITRPARTEAFGSS